MYIFDHNRRNIEKKFNELCENGSFNDLSINQMKCVYLVVKSQGLNNLKKVYVRPNHIEFHFSQIYLYGGGEQVNYIIKLEVGTTLTREEK